MAGQVGLPLRSSRTDLGAGQDGADCMKSTIHYGKWGLLGIMSFGSALSPGGFRSVRVWGERNEKSCVVRLV